MPIGRSQAVIASPANAVATVPDIERVEPQLRELMGLAAYAAALPSWSRSIRATQSGQYLSTLRGRGMEYDESRAYQPGDDIRLLDWRVTARTDKPHTKLFREERERPVFLCVDYRRGMFFATRGVFKAVQAARAASVLAWRAQQNGDRIGGLVFADSEHHELPPRRGKTAAIQWVKLLCEQASKVRTAATADGIDRTLADTMTRLRRVAKPGSLIFLVSDFRAFNDHCKAELVRLAGHTDIALIAIHDPLEARLPALDEAASVSDGHRTVRLAGITTRQRAHYAEQFTRRIEGVRQHCRDHRLLFTTIDTTADPIAALVKLLGG